MPSLHKRARSPFWFASFQDAKGRWLKKSTKTKDRTLAMKLALEWDASSSAGRSGRLVEAQCRQVLSEIHEQATGSRLEFHTCEEWLAEWLKGKQGATGERTLLKYNQVLRDFTASLGPRKNVPLEAISIADVRRFRDVLVRDGKCPTTVNQSVRNVLSAPFAAAVRAGFISVNPCAGVEQIKDGADVEKDVFTCDQVKDLCAAATGDWPGVILAGFYTGLRLRDITNLCWEAVDLNEQVLRIRTGKTGAKLLIPIADELLKWLNAQPRAIAKASVFPSVAGKSGSGKSGLSMQFKRIMEKAGIRGRVLRRRMEQGLGRTQSSLSFHSLRHSFNSALANAGVPQETRQKLTGHASAAMNSVYTHMALEPLRAAIGRLPPVFLQ